MSAIAAASLALMWVMIAARLQRTSLRRFARQRTVERRAHPQGRRSAGVLRRLSLRRHAASDAAMLAVLLDDIARRCSTGESIRQAFEAAVAASPIEPMFHAATVAVRRGATLQEALQSLVRTVDDADRTLAVHVLQLCAAHGGSVSESLDRAAGTLREREAVSLERFAHSAQARLSAQVLTLLPICFGAWAFVGSGSVRHFIASPVGGVCVLVGLALNVVGWQLMSRTIRAAP